MDFDYTKLGLKAGIEIHQQLDTKEKLFCHCPTVLRDVPEHTGEFFPYLRATASEMGEPDPAPRHLASSRLRDSCQRARRHRWSTPTHNRDSF